MLASRSRMAVEPPVRSASAESAGDQARERQGVAASAVRGVGFSMCHPKDANASHMHKAAKGMIGWR